MVYSGERREERLARGGGAAAAAVAMEERSKPPLHNFNFPFLKWGNQRHLRCMKVPDSDDGGVGGGFDRHRRSNRSPPSKFLSLRGFDVGGGFKTPPPRIGSVGGGGAEGIEAVRERIMLDLKTAADRMKAAILRKEESSSEDEDDDEGDVSGEFELFEGEKRQFPAPASEVAAAPPPWNLRTRRAACKAPMGGISKGLRIEEKKPAANCSPARSETAKSPRLRGESKRGREEEKEKERPKFAVALTRAEIEEDFREMVGQRPARRPKKRPRNVQKQLDSLFPGLWLTEVTVDTYKVPEIPDAGKR